MKLDFTFIFFTPSLYIMQNMIDFGREADRYQFKSGSRLMWHDAISIKSMQIKSYIACGKTFVKKYILEDD